MPVQGDDQSSNEAATAAAQHQNQDHAERGQCNDYRTCGDLHICLALQPRQCACVRWELGLNGLSSGIRAKSAFTGQTEQTTP